MLELAQYALVAAVIFTVLAFVTEILMVTGRASATSDVRSRQKNRLSFYANAFVGIAILLLTFYLIVRLINTGHGPFANQHEFSVSFSWGILIALVFFANRYRLHVLSLVVLPVVILMLAYSTQLDTEIKPLVPALQNNLLLTFHVGFAVLAYGAACVSFGAAVLYLIQPYLNLKHGPRPEVLDEVGYRAAAVTFPLLTIMIILGSVWANTAWGRYWGWDPKETAAFVTWLIYGAFLHARVVRDWRGTKAAWLLVIGFAAVLFAYFGNHFFGGLHSYA
ncbi:MAG: c-type cytochrome biogenesis protein CcsB [Actinomycetaceae bacterium]|nr:c-type cytochrome biogenesis protein CcsB [Actinomycetaceae bacterium]